MKPDTPLFQFAVFSDSHIRLLTAYPAQEMIHSPVSRTVNSLTNDTPECVVQKI